MKELWKGNEAMAEAAVRAGCKLYVGYPITPQSEIVEYMSARMPELGRTFIQSESEIISINTVIGGSLTGERCMTSSSGVGISLMQEGLTDAFAKGITSVLINVNRCSCGMGGDFGGSTDDYLRDTRGGGNGDYHLIVLTPNTIQEAVEMVYQAWDIAEKYRNPVEIMTEGRLGQMMECIELPPFKDKPKESWGIDGTTKPMPDYKPMHDNDALYRERMDAMRENEQRWESYYTEDAEVVLVALGLCSRVCKGAVDKCRAQGKKVGLLRVISAWPFPIKGFEELPDTMKKLVCVEVSNEGQVIEDVLIASRKVKKLHHIPVYNYFKPHLFKSDEVMEFLTAVELEKVKEVG